jgi:hypothetical protein
MFDALAARPGFLDQVPPSQRQPILRLRWNGTEVKRTPALARLDYGGETFEVADIERKSWNREIFQLLNYLASAAVLDPNKLPVQQLIQVR